MKIMLPKLETANVLVVGDVMLDRYWHGSTDRISPESPVPVVNIKQDESRPGGAANVAMNVTSLGGKAKLIGFTGEDEAEKRLSESLRAKNVESHFIKHPTNPTITKLRVLSRHQQLIRLDFEEGFIDHDYNKLNKKIDEVLSSVNVIVLSDYNKGVLKHVELIIQKAKGQNIPVLIDPKGTNFERYRGATLLTPNLSEFEAVVGKCNSEDELINKGMALIKQFELNALLVTRSEKGMTLLQLNHPPHHLPAQAKDVFDVTGAGDTVIATMAAGLSALYNLIDSCSLANAAASVVVGKLGTATVTPVELEDALGARDDNGFGVMNEAQLKVAVENARKRGERIVMTNGCFDILHAGHVSYLANARKLGDRLIVAVNDDQSVKQLKGQSRPINPLEQRMIVLGALDAVDWVISFNEETPQRLISHILPDILVKGGDYLPEQIAGGKEVIAAGGQVSVLNFEDGCSTTQIIERIKQAQE